MNLEEIIPDIELWSLRNWGEGNLPLATLGLAEESGEVCRAVLKQNQGIRGTHDEWQEEIKKELGDVFIKIVDVAMRADIDVADAILKRWASIRMRDWLKNPKGHGIEKG